MIFHASGQTPRSGDLDRPDDSATTGVLDVPRDEDIDDLDWDLEPQFEHDHDGAAPGIVVFDVGEVLIDESRVWAIWADILGVSPFTFAAVMGAAIVQGEDHTSVFAHIAPNIEWREFEEEHERRYGGFGTGDLYSDAVPCLTELKDLGFRVAIAGNQPARRRQQLADLELPHDRLAVSADLGANKPDRAFFDAVMALVDASDPAEVLYVGDRIDNDVLPAAVYGMRTCWLRRGPWGQLQDLPMESDADLVLDGLGELPLILQQWRAEGAGEATP